MKIASSKAGSVAEAAWSRPGGLSRKDPVRRLELKSGDVIWFGGPSRLIYHGVEGDSSRLQCAVGREGFKPKHRVCP
ncbi:MAG TPA: alpha-ketoglutarate-dependent dioxygenase AlkB [Roseiarcus sp.]|nr:alpha-ketoglutarate-dependent dioxygenase AlkB [Roseiarcus sp.]